jgi:UDP-N-acetylmuramate dehydrogenase
LVISSADFLERLSGLPQVHFRQYAPLSAETRFGIGGPVRLLVDAASAQGFWKAYRLVLASGEPHLVLGGGTNLIVSDLGYDGVILRYLGARIQLEDDHVEVESGADLDTLVQHCVEAGRAGLESMRRIPGWVGAAVYGNAGAYGQQVSDTLAEVRYFDGRRVSSLTNEECRFAYRTSRFKQRKDWVVLSARFALRPGDRPQLAERAEQIRATRDAKFPPTMKCAGSIFKNLHFAQLAPALQQRLPASAVQHGKVPAAWFLEQVGAKGRRDGGIRVADYHANLIYNEGGGTARELTRVIDTLKADVAREFGLTIEEEVQYVGFPDRQSY